MLKLLGFIPMVLMSALALAEPNTDSNFACAVSSESSPLEFTNTWHQETFQLKGETYRSLAERNGYSYSIHIVQSDKVSSRFTLYVLKDSQVLSAASTEGQTLTLIDFNSRSAVSCSRF